MKSDSPFTRRTFVGLSLLVLAAIAPWLSCLPIASMLGFDSRANVELLAKLDNQPEAREWIRNSGRAGPLASNRFEGKEDALAFVNALYEAGAVKVVVDAIMDDELEMAEGGPYADALIVRMPTDVRKRLRLMSIASTESLKRGEPVADVGLETMYFWWD